MNIYGLLKFNRFLKNHRLKFLALYGLHQLNQRYLAVHFDPVNACNLRCKMCYFTDEDYVKKLKGTFDKNDLPRLGETVLKRALKLQVGCGTEPTLYNDLGQVFLLAKKYKVPHISLTTNANLIKKEKLQQWVESGLQEIIVSLHGVHRRSYEDFMEKGNYDTFHQSLQIISDIKKKYKTVSLRINYTFNEDNFKELSEFFTVFGQYSIDVLQLRPINNLGNTSYQNFSMQKVIPMYNSVLQDIKKECEKRKIILIAAENATNLVGRKNRESLIYPYTYCYISPTDFWHEDFDWKRETYNEYALRKKIPQEMFQNVFSSAKKLEKLQTENLNYKIS